MTSPTWVGVKTTPKGPQRFEARRRPPNRFLGEIFFVLFDMEIGWGPNLTVPLKALSVSVTPLR